MKKINVLIGLLSILVCFVSCSRDESNSIDTSKAIRAGNFLQAADFNDVSKLKIYHSDKYVTEYFEKGEAEFKYSQSHAKSLADYSGYSEQTTQITLSEEQLVEFEEGETYILEFSYYFNLEREVGEDESDFRYRFDNARRNVLLKFQLHQALKDENDDYYHYPPINLGDGGDMPLNDKWQTYRRTIKPMIKELGKYWNINFTIKNQSKQNNQSFFIRNIQLVKE